MDTTFSEAERLAALQKTRTENQGNKISGNDRLLSRMYPQKSENSSINPDSLPEDEQHRFLKMRELQLGYENSNTISSDELKRSKKAQKIISFYNETHWFLLNFSRWIFDILDLASGVGTIISLPINIYIIIRFLKLKRITETKFVPYEYFCMIVEFIPIADLYPGMAEMIRKFKDEAKKAKKQAEKDLINLQRKYPNII